MTAVELTSHEFIRVTGPDARQFLQGQVSCDVGALSGAHSLRGALCNLKGRVITDFRLLLDGDDCLLQVQQGMAEPVLQTLKKYAVFSKVELLQDQSFASVTGLMGDATPNWIAEHVGKPPETVDAVTSTDQALIVRLPGSAPRFEIWSRDPIDTTSLTPVESALQQWQAEDIASGIVHVTPAISEQYTPQLLNYDISGVINFKKGCYTGQEVVARMFYRGKPKKRLYRLCSDQPLSITSVLVDADSGEDIKAEILACASAADAGNGSHCLLAIVDTELAEASRELTLAADRDASVKFATLPYTA